LVAHFSGSVIWRNVQIEAIYKSQSIWNRFAYLFVKFRG